VLALGAACSDLGDLEYIDSLTDGIGNQEQLLRIERMQTGLLCLRMKGLLAVVLAGKEERSNEVSSMPCCRPKISNNLPYTDLS
jgi:hypothetical protein